MLIGPVLKKTHPYALWLTDVFVFKLEKTLNLRFGQTVVSETLNTKTCQ